MSQDRIFLIGPMGAGKTVVGKKLAGLLHYDFYDSDQEVERKLGADIPWIFDLEGESGFREREAKVIGELTKLPKIVLATGGGCVMTPQNRQVLAARGLVVYLYVALDQQFERLMQSKHNHRPTLKNNDPRAFIEQMQLVREPLYRSIADMVYDTTSQNVDMIAEGIMKAL